MQVAIRPANEFAPLLLAKERGQAAQQAQSSATHCSETWSASTPDALVTMMSDATTDGVKQ